MSFSMDFSGAVVLITGSSSGIGSSIALAYARAGARVVVTGLPINTSAITSVAKQCSDVSPINAKALEVVADVSKEDDCKRLIEDTIKEFGKLDILVNCAGILIKTNISDEKHIENFKTVLATDLNSCVYLTHYSVEYLAKTKGNIINISSIQSVRAAPDSSPYCMAKAAIDMFTRCMSVELGAKGIRVNSVNPGAIDTPMQKLRPDCEAYYKRVAQNYPVGRIGVGEDIANAVMYLTSKQASFITGINYIVDGGHIAGNVNV